MKKIPLFLLLFLLLALMLTPAAAQTDSFGTVILGTYEQDNDPGNGPEPIEWLVLTTADGRALVVSRFGLDKKSYNNSFEDVTWENSEIRSWLNGPFYDTAFSADDRDRILSTVIRNPDNPKSSMGHGGADTEDRVFLLSIDEVNSYLDSDLSRQCKPSAFAAAMKLQTEDGFGWWWLRTPGNANFMAMLINSAGAIGAEGDVCRNLKMIRPAMWVKMAEAAPRPTPRGPTVYTVQTGDTCAALASQYNFSIAEFIDVNHLDEKCSLTPGQMVILPSELETEGISAGEQAWLRGDYSGALAELVPAANAGDPAAEYRLGWMYEHGQGVEQSCTSAVRYYRQAADHGSGEGSLRLGHLYYRAECVPEDNALAEIHYSNVPSRLSMDQIPAFDKGAMYLQGWGLEQSYDKAVENYEIAAAEGDSWAMSELGILYLNGVGVKKSTEKALEYLYPSAEQNNLFAQYTLGLLYYSGDGVDQSYETAAQYFKASADQGYHRAQYAMGVCYEGGLGVNASDTQALYYYQLAADQGNEDAIQSLAALQQRMSAPTATATPKPTSTPRPTSTPTPRPTAKPKPTSTPAPNIIVTEKPPVIFGSGTTPTATPTAPIATAFPKIDARVGRTITFGSYEQDGNTKNGKEPIAWQVLAVENGRALLISKFGLDIKPYHNRSGVKVTWETCSLRSWLNSDFLSTAFTAAEQQRIAEVKISTPNNATYWTSGGKSTTDMVFLLSANEAEKYFSDDYARRCEPTSYAKNRGALVQNGSSLWWLRTPGYSQTYAVDVPDTGYIRYYGYDISYSNHVVRPAIWIILQ